MYTDFYDLTGKPFQLTPDPDFYVDTKTHHRAMAYLTYGLAQGEGFIIITGDIGAGKTTLVARLLQDQQGSDVVIGNIVTSMLTGGDLLRLAAEAFQVQPGSHSKGDILAGLERFFRAQHRQGNRVVLVVDEAQNLPFEALEELRMLSNFQEGGEPLLQTILLGQPEFRQRLATAPELEQLRQRMIASHHLAPMQREELKTYIESRLSRCGWDGTPSLDEEAYDELYRASGGVPRRINNLAARMLLFGALEERREIDGPLVREVVADLGIDNAAPQSESFRSEVAAARGVGGGQGGFRSGGNGGGGDAGASSAAIMRLEERSDRHDQVLKQLLRVVSDMSGQIDELAHHSGNGPVE